MPTNLEIKAHAASVAAVVETARRIGARPELDMAQVDTYFDVRQGRLKLREIDGERVELICYRRGEGEERRVSEFDVLPFAAAEPIKSMLRETLGVRGVVTKHRTLYRYRSTRIHADDVAGLGTFLEFETEVGGSPDEAMEELNSLIHLFGIGERDFVRVSYIDLILAKGGI